MTLLLFAAALTIVLAALGALWAGLRPPADDPAPAGHRLHHTTTCRCPREPEGVSA
ncbi:hypothetical protein [Actinoallomurus iriomotensis]|uniref:Uncharacterized protein n=1 Tax=Actinoallomurus iriomotensis TaxID=478107 RepID=A0A9W6VWS1_9ACTN|nr:hypothetical protein [Actinoallomurus iriomotensis]GLY81877.1 hypothetical protein Airi01_101440 [Actinoallomurus iriomotensis]